MRGNCSPPRAACATPANCRPAARSAASRQFFLGAADNPIDPPPGWEPKSLAAKIEAGAQFVQTQFCMDAQVVRRYLARLDEAGLGGKLSFLIGVAPLRSAQSARWMKEKLFGTIIPDAFVTRMEQASDPVAEGRAHLPRGDRRARRDSAGQRLPHHGAEQRRRRAGGDRGSAQDVKLA